MTDLRVAYYAHHHGSGHLTRARLIRDACPIPVDILSSIDDDAVDVVLPPDHDPGDDRPTADDDARGVLHYAPRYESRLAPRIGALASWVEAVRPALAVVDVSVEVALQFRLLGVPVVTVRQHGQRSDRAHRLAYDVSDCLLAPYPAWAEGDGVRGEDRDRTYYAGGFSRFDGRRRRRLSGEHPVVVMVGTGGTTIEPARVARLASVLGGSWVVLGADGEDTERVRFLGHVDEPWEWLCSARAVVTSAGHNALCEAAAAGAPTIAVVEPRPFDEQEHKVAVLERNGVVRRAPAWDDVEGWCHALRSVSHPSKPWAAFVDGCGASRAARHVARLADLLHRHGRVHDGMCGGAGAQ